MQIQADWPVGKWPVAGAEGQAPALGVSVRPILPCSPGVGQEPVGGSYLPVKMGLVVNCLVDSGSALAIIHPRKFEALSLKHRCVTERVGGNLWMPDGSVVELQMALSEIDAPLLLEFIVWHHGGVLDAAQGTLRLSGHFLKCMPESRLPSVFLELPSLKWWKRAPPGSEMILQGRTQGNPVYTSAFVVPNCFLVAGQKNSLVGKILVDSNTGQVPLQVVIVSSKFSQALSGNLLGTVPAWGGYRA